MKKRLESILIELDIPFREESHSAVFTVEESKQHLSEKVPVKSLLLQEKRGDALVLVVMAGDKRLDTNQVNEHLGLKKLAFARPDTLQSSLGVTPGSVSLFSLLHEGSEQVVVVIDKELLDEDEVGFHPNDNTSTIFIPGEAITRFIQFTGHSYSIIGLRL